MRGLTNLTSCFALSVLVRVGDNQSQKDAEQQGQR